MKIGKIIDSSTKKKLHKIAEEEELDQEELEYMKFKELERDMGKYKDTYEKRHGKVRRR
jgi:hypothetical protein